MRENLDRELGRDAEDTKRRWYKRTRINDLLSFSTQLLKSYRRFVSFLFFHVLDYKEVTKLDNSILEELATRRDFSPYDCEVFALALEYNKGVV